jgi:ABC-type transport system substrate-binding protein
MRRNLFILLAGILWLASCTPQITPVITPTDTPLPSATPVLHAPEIRFALIGEPRDVNVWELFDESGASYADYALRSEYWPRLYHLAPPQFTFEALAAEGMPSSVVQDGEFYSATVALRKDLKWTDGTPFTAEDVAFTVNTALAFELGFDWSAYYPLEYIERVDVIDPSTVKFIFRKQPNVGVWQYGALQGPILQKAFWEPRILEAASLLPDDALRTDLHDARANLQVVQARVDELNTQANTMAVSGQDNRGVLAQLADQQNNLIFAKNTQDKLVEQTSGQLDAARRALYAVGDSGEPTLGTWMPAGRQNGAWVNEANSDFPFIQPNFDRAVYSFFGTEADAEESFENNLVDMILYPVSPFPPRIDPSQIKWNVSGSAGFLVFNPSSPIFSTPAWRQVFSCIVWFPSRTVESVPLSGLILPGNNFWIYPDANTPCSDLTDANIELRWPRIVEILKSAGYAWEQEPGRDSPGSGLVMPNGQAVPSVKMLGLSEDVVTTQPMTDNYIAESARKLGLPITVEYGSPADIRYEVFSSKNYDMAVLNWNLSLYPGYLCDWFGAGGQFEYGRESLRSECAALAVESDLEIARNHILQIQSILMQDLPFIPLYADVRYDAYSNNVQYPFESVLGGLGGLYGAPSYAMPAP